MADLLPTGEIRACLDTHHCKPQRFLSPSELRHALQVTAQAEPASSKASEATSAAQHRQDSRSRILEHGMCATPGCALLDFHFGPCSCQWAEGPRQRRPPKSSMSTEVQATGDDEAMEEALTMTLCAYKGVPLSDRLCVHQPSPAMALAAARTCAPPATTDAASSASAEVSGRATMALRHGLNESEIILQLLQTRLVSESPPAAPPSEIPRYPAAPQVMMNPSPLKVWTKSAKMEAKVSLPAGLFEVEAPIRGRRERKGVVEYLVKWRGFSEEHNSWEPRVHLGECIGLVDDYEYAHADAWLFHTEL